ncbi:MAG: hypothetical protein QOI51_807 [Nocardioidaceae bacterium]|jgi:hypothetical protein|nr:hypothetical protein [Nocardioidaceae bacterium]
MAIGSLDKAGRLEQLRTFARCQVWAGYRSETETRDDVYDAALAEEHDPERASRLTDELVGAARRELAAASEGWPSPTGFERLRAALADLRDSDIVVLEGVDDHWAAAETLATRAAAGRTPRGVAFFSLPDVWHAVEHGMLEINVWHGDTSNVAPGDPLLDLVLSVLGEHQIAAVFDEGRIEATLSWQRRPSETDPDVG